jgi:hypothetical protein
LENKANDPRISNEVESIRRCFQANLENSSNVKGIKMLPLSQHDFDSLQGLIKDWTKMNPDAKLFRVEQTVAYLASQVKKCESNCKLKLLLQGLSNFQIA